MTGIIEARIEPGGQRPGNDGHVEVAAFTVNYAKHSICSMMQAEIGDCKLQALTNMLGCKRMWVAYFGVAASIACWILVPHASAEDVAVQLTTPWQDMTYEMWHVCRSAPDNER